MKCFRNFFYLLTIIAAFLVGKTCFILSTLRLFIAFLVAGVYRSRDVKQNLIGVCRLYKVELVCTPDRFFRLLFAEGGLGD
jgi:hypothetical protein